MRLISLCLSAVVASSALFSVSPAYAISPGDIWVQEGACSGNICIQERQYGTYIYTYEVTYQWFDGFGWVATSEKLVSMKDTRNFQIEQ